MFSDCWEVFGVFVETVSKDVLGLRFCVFCGWISMIVFIIFAIFGYLPYLGMSNVNRNPKVKMSSAFWRIVFVCLCCLCFSLVIWFILGCLHVVVCVILG